ncbi:aminopeptidase [Candidatus Woesearchaeota archaeon]|nr:aminopeptidase [Candidatus Woesearchaeota archaeon]
MLEKPSNTILRNCMALKKNESCLIITDSKLSRIGHSLYKNSLKITKKSKIILIPIPEAHGSEPPSGIAKEMLRYDVILMPTTKSLSHTTARKTASVKGARIASMPGITMSMMKRTLNVDFNKIKSINEKLINKLNNKNKIRITTKKGTDVLFQLKGRKWISDDGIYTKKGAFGNLPAGEVFIAPLENKANGIIVADASVGGLGKVDENIIVKIKNGFIQSITGGNVAAEFKKLLKNRLYRNVAELGIGTNYKAKITGEVLEDEKVSGTFHVAFGNNMHFGGKVDVPFHVDFVVKNPMIYADGEIIKKEKYPKPKDFYITLLS